MYKIRMEAEVLKFLKKHKGGNIAKRFREKAKEIAKNPYNNHSDIKTLLGSDFRYRLRIWKYRFIYEIKNKELIIIFVHADTRWGIYK